MNKKSRKIVWSKPSLAQINEAVAYVRQYSPDAAKRLRQEIRDAAKRLKDFPFMGRALPELPDELFRELIVRDYRIIYGVADTHVEVLMVVHGSRDLLALPAFKELLY